MPLKRIGDLSPQETCTHPEHNPPSHMVFQEGHYEYTCPGCGKVTKFTIRNPKWVASSGPLVFVVDGSLSRVLGGYGMTTAHQFDMQLTAALGQCSQARTELLEALRGMEGQP